MNKEQVLKKLKVGIDVYENFLINHEFLIFFSKKNNTYDYKKVSFEKHNFKHLTGIVTKLSPHKFYDNIKEHKITHNDIALKENGTTRLKLAILDKMHLPFYRPSMIGEYFGGSKIYLDADEVIGTNRISIGLKELTSKDYLAPSSLLKEDVKIVTNPTFSVLFVLKKQNNENYFNEITYCKSDFCLKTFFNQNEKLITELPLHEELLKINQKKLL